MRKLAVFFGFGILLFCMTVFSHVTFAMSASGTWGGNDGYVSQSGIVNFNFPAMGGPVNGTYSGGGNKMSFHFEGRFTGDFEGCFGGEMSGSFSGWYSYVVEDKLETGKAGGNWTGTLNDNGTITANFSGVSSGGVTAHYNIAELEKVCGPKGGGASIGEFKNFSGAYVIVDGEKIDLEEPENVLTKIKFRRGMTIGTYDKNSWCDIKLEDGSELYLSGEGSEVSVITMADIDKDLWKKTVGNLPEGTVITASPGQIVVKYKTGTEEGYLFPQSKADKEAGVEMGPADFVQTVEGSEDKLDFKYVFFSTPDASADFSELADAIGNAAALRDYGHKAPPLEVIMPEIQEDEDSGGAVSGFLGLLFGNHSEVKYDYDGENINVEVIEGNVEVFDTNFKGEVVKIADIRPGDDYSINVEDYYKNKAEGAVESKSSAIDVGGEKGTKSTSDVNSGVNWLLYGGIGVGVLIVLAVVIILYNFPHMKR